jgi:4-hydroxy-tetrahydrodipicolinate reductase
MKTRYKIIVWGPGRLGGLAIWEIANSVEFELVGLRVYSDSKEGVDAGDLIGIAPLGVKATRDVDALLRIDCDCVLYTAHDQGTYHTDDEILRILAAGKNVITPLPYQNAHLFRDAEFLAKLDAACRQGKATFSAGGIDPDLISNRVLLGLTGACADVKSIKLQENWDCTEAGKRSPEQLKYIGMGMKPAEAEKITVTQIIAANFTKAITYTTEKVLGVRYDRVEESHDYIPTPKDIHEPFFIAAGTVARITHRMQGFVDSIGPQPFFTIEYHWLIGQTMLPDGTRPGEDYVATIEGRPSMRMVLNFRVSHQSDALTYQLGNQAVEPTYVAILTPCMQAIPHLCAAPPGLLPSFDPSLHWMPDLRDSVARP